MRAPISAGMVAVGIVLLWAAFTGRLNCLTGAWACIVTGTPDGGAMPAGNGARELSIGGRVNIPRFIPPIANGIS